MLPILDVRHTRDLRAMPGSREWAEADRVQALHSVLKHLFNNEQQRHSTLPAMCLIDLLRRTKSSLSLRQLQAQGNCKRSGTRDPAREAQRICWITALTFPLASRSMLRE